MKSFQQFIAEATYDPDIQGKAQIKEIKHNLQVQLISSRKIG